MAAGTSVRMRIVAGRITDGRSDLYAVGIVLWELLALKRLRAGLPSDAVRAMNASCRRLDSCWIRARSAAESAGGSETLDTTLILFVFVLSWFATLAMYHVRDLGVIHMVR